MDTLDLLAKALCSHCGQTREILQPRNTNLDLFNTNRQLLQAEEEIITVRRNAARQEVSAVGALISAAEDQLERLKEHREALTGCILQCTQLLSPLRRLPREVLIEIVKLTILADNSSAGDTLNVKVGPWPLSHVCSSWRRAIVDTPTIWSNINIDGIVPCYAASILYKTIKRSQYVPLDIFFKSGEADLSKHLFQILCSQSDRWRSLGLWINPSHWPYLNQTRGSLAQLRSLKLDIMDAKSADITLDDDFFAFAPKLQTVQLGMKGVGNKSLPVLLKFPKEPIVKFELWFSKDSHSCLPDIIPRTVVDLFVGSRASRSTVALAPAIYPCTRSLEVSRASSLLDALACPKMEALIITEMRLDENFMAHFQQFVNRCTQGRTFPYLQLEDTSVIGEALPLRLFQAVKFLTILKLSYVLPISDILGPEKTWIKQFTLLLTPLVLTTNRSNDVLPSLTHPFLYLDDCKPTASLHRLIHSVVDSRVNPPTGYGGEKLSEFVLENCQSGKEVTSITLSTYDTLLQQAELVE